MVQSDIARDTRLDAVAALARALRTLEHDGNPADPEDRDFARRLHIVYEAALPILSRATEVYWNEKAFLLGAYYMNDLSADVPTFDPANLVKGAEWWYFDAPLHLEKPLEVAPDARIWKMGAILVADMAALGLPGVRHPAFPEMGELDMAILTFCRLSPWDPDMTPRGLWPTAVAAWKRGAVLSDRTCAIFPSPVIAELNDPASIEEARTATSGLAKMVNGMMAWRQTKVAVTEPVLVSRSCRRRHEHRAAALTSSPLVITLRAREGTPAVTAEQYESVRHHLAPHDVRGHLRTNFRTGKKDIRVKPHRRGGKNGEAPIEHPTTRVLVTR